MVEHSRNNIFKFSQDNDFILEDFEFIKLNAKFINESTILLEKEIDAIVTE
jgi:tRNA G10  N-methylase Trm11